MTCGSIIPAAREAAAQSGTTQYAIYGINFLGTEANWAAASPSSTDGIWFGNDGDGGATVDYLAYVGNHAGVQTELLGAAASGLSQSNHTTSIFTTLFPSPPSETVGTPGKTWAAVEIDQTNGTLIWKINGTAIAQRANTSSFTSGNIMLGLMDIFSFSSRIRRLIPTSFTTMSEVENLVAPYAPSLRPPSPRIHRERQLESRQGMASFSVTFGRGINADGLSMVSKRGAAGRVQTNATLPIVTNVQPANAGEYYAQASNGAGSALSNPALLTVSTNWALITPQIVNQQFQFTLLGLANVSYIIDFSSNLPNWIPLQTNYPGLFIGWEHRPNFPARFYPRRAPAP